MSRDQHGILFNYYRGILFDYYLQSLHHRAKSPRFPRGENLVRFLPAPLTGCVFSVERRFATGACTPNGVRIMDAPVVIATAVTGADENGCLSLSKAPR